MESIYEQLNKINDEESLNESYATKEFEIPNFNARIIDEFEDEGIKGYNIVYSKNGTDIVEVEVWETNSPVAVNRNLHTPHLMQSYYSSFDEFASDLEYKTSRYVCESADKKPILKTKQSGGQLTRYDRMNCIHDEDSLNDSQSIMNDYGFEAGDNDMNDLYYYKEDNKNIFVVVHGNEAASTIKYPQDGRRVDRSTAVTLSDNGDEVNLGTVTAEYELSSFGTYYVIADSNIENKVWELLNNYLKSQREV